MGSFLLVYHAMHLGPDPGKAAQLMYAQLNSLTVDWCDECGRQQTEDIRVVCAVWWLGRAGGQCGAGSVASPATGGGR